MQLNCAAKIDQSIEQKKIILKACVQFVFRCPCVCCIEVLQKDLFETEHAEFRTVILHPIGFFKRIPYHSTPLLILPSQLYQDRLFPAMTTIYEDCWTAHFTAHNAIGVAIPTKAANVANTYSEDAILKEFNYKTNKERIFTGRDEIRQFFEWHLGVISVPATGDDYPPGSLMITPDFHTYPLKPDGSNADVNVEGSTVFVKWSAKTDQIYYTRSADSFFMKEVSEGTAKIAYHFQHVHY